MQLKVHPKQALVDMAMMGAGHARAWYDTAVMNGLSLTDELDAGAVVNVPDAEGADRYAAAQLRLPHKLPASELMARPDGIDYMQILNDFIIS